MQVSYADKHIVEAYSGLFEGLSSGSKLELIECLSKSLETSESARGEKFFTTFGAFSDDKTAEEIIEDIESSRKFRNKDVSF